MAVTDDYPRYVLGQLAGLEHLASRPMFGGVGLYYQERFFAIIMRDTLYFKVNDANRRDYESRGMQVFRPYPDRPTARSAGKPRGNMAYFEVPADVLEDPEECVVWAMRSVAAAGPNFAAPRKGAPPIRAPARRQPARSRKSRQRT
jgi:DNA transformation protein